MLYHAVTELGLDGGICVTASHNPKEYTGMKIVRRGALPVGGDSGLAEIRARPRPDFDPTSTSRGAIRSEDVWPSFVAEGSVVRRSGRDPPAPRRRSTPRTAWPARCSRPCSSSLPQLDVVRCYFEPDGSFPNHEPNPLLPENREFIVAR